MTFTLRINGTPHAVDVDGDTPLQWLLRDYPISFIGMTKVTAPAPSGTIVQTGEMGSGSR
jgi:aerobic-type carbon monoxide dehydrogenase small subunit (CoxS/CutS family)